MKVRARNIVFYRSYYQDFFEIQRRSAKKKIGWTLDLIVSLDKIPETYLKHISNSNGLYEIRVQVSNDIFRIFCFFDEGNLIVIANGFQKKTQKTPYNEIKKAEKIKKEYYENKKKGFDISG